MNFDLSSVSPAELADVLQNYSIDQRSFIFSRLFLPGVHEGGSDSLIRPVTDYAMPISTSDRVVLSELSVGGQLQPGVHGTKGFTPRESTKIKARIGKVDHIKVDNKFSQAKIFQLVKSYWGQVKAKRYDPTTYPFEAEVVGLILKTMSVELRQALWNAEENPTGDTNLDVFDGWLKQLNACILSEEIPQDNIYVSGAITSGNVLDVFDEVPQIIPTQYAYDPSMVCLTSRRLQEMYELAYRDKYNSLPYNLTQEKKQIVGSNIPFLVEPSLDGYNFPIFIKKDNLAYLFEDEGAMTKLDFYYNKEERAISYMADFQAGAAISQPDLIWMAQ